jgi:hypothetical protein
MNKIIYISLLATLFNVPLTLNAQETAKIVTLKSEKKFEFDGKGSIIINTERGNINIQSWERNEVSVVLKLTAKNTNLSKAKEELSYMNYNLLKRANNIIFNNKMERIPGKVDEISSIIKAEYEIRAPKKVNLQISNQFGQVTINNTSGTIHGELHYCDLSLQSFNGDIIMEINIGDFNCSQSSLTGVIKTTHANISLSEVSGKFIMTTAFGNFKLSYGEKPLNFELNANATDIWIDNRKCHPVDIKLNGSYCPLRISESCYTPNKSCLNSSYQPSLEQDVWLLRYTVPDKSNKLIIHAKFGTMNLM